MLRISVLGALRLIIKARNVTFKSHVAGKGYHETNKLFIIDTTFPTVLITTNQEKPTITTIELIGTVLALLHDPDPDPDPEIIISLQHFLHKTMTKRKLPMQMPLVLLWTSLYTDPTTATIKAKLQPIQMTNLHWIVLLSKRSLLR